MMAWGHRYHLVLLQPFKPSLHHRVGMYNRGLNPPRTSKLTTRGNMALRLPR
jgi:hypothetical protein